MRLDRLSRGQERLERQLGIVAEALGVFVQHQLTVLAHQPQFDEETGKLGMKRYRAFIEFVGRRLAASESELRLIPREEREDD